jgi:hypothetical protein
MDVVRQQRVGVNAQPVVIGCRVEAIVIVLVILLFEKDLS